MTNDKPLPIKLLLAPFAMLYWLGTSIRNWLFEIGVLSQQKFEHLTVISIGNISMGGTGKTPFTEHIVRMLKEDNNVAILSRGYKRKTRGYRLATTESVGTQHPQGVDGQSASDYPWRMYSAARGDTCAVCIAPMPATEQRAGVDR